MKNKLLVLLVAFMFVGTASFGQFTFSVSPGLNFNGASFGYKIADKIVPFIGIQYVGGNVSATFTGYDWDGGTGVERFTNEMEGKGSIIMPNIGVKFFALESNGLKAYAKLNFAKPIIKAEVKFDGEEIDEIPEYVDAVKIWAGELGIGVEYFFADNFSIGGEFGLTHMNVKYDFSETREVYNGVDYQDETFTEEVKVGVSPTYSRVSLNFYF